MENKKAISLIVLVITIIVMVILAGAIIITLNNSGIISKATEAVDETNETTVKEVAQLAWAEAYMNGKTTQEELEDAVLDKLNETNIDMSKYIVTVTTSGVKIKSKKDMWVKDGFTVVRGDDVLKIGDTINYDEGVASYTAGWKVLGADDEGNLLIMSAGDVKTGCILGDETGKDLGKSQQDWLNGPSILDAECKPYGDGIGAIDVRSIRIEDVNSVTGYDPKTAQYGKGDVSEYGNEVTYAWDTTDASNVKIKYSGTLNDAAGSVEYSYDVFTWYDEKTGTFPSVDKGVTTTSLPTLMCTSYGYSPSNLTISAIENRKAFEMLFGERNADNGGYSAMYWLASRFVSTLTDGVYYGLDLVHGDYVWTFFNLWNSSGWSGFYDYGVRAVVTLSSDIKLTGSSETGWTYTVN